MSYLTFWALGSLFDHRENKTIIKMQHVEFIGWWPWLMGTVRSVVGRAEGGTGLLPALHPGQEPFHSRECLGRREACHLCVSYHVYSLRHS